MADPSDPNNPNATMADILMNGSGPQQQNGAGYPLAAMAASLLTPNYINPAYATPKQREQLYAYGAGEMKPQPVRRISQGMAEIARALVGGNALHQADVAEQASVDQAAKDQADGPGMLISPANSSAAAPSATTAPTQPMAYAGSDGAPAVPGLIASSSAKYRIDPAVATQFFAGESNLDPNAKGDYDAQGNPTSFGVPQLHVTGDPKHPAMGDQFIAETGLDPKDPKNAPQAIDYALRRASKEGWGAWANTRDKLGYDNFTGIGALPADASSFAGNVPQAAAPQPQHPFQMAQSSGAMPVSREAYARFKANPNISNEDKARFDAQVMPRIERDANGNLIPIYQNQAARPPIAQLGAETNISGVPGVRTGPIGKPVTNLALPASPTTGAPPNIAGPGSAISDINQQKAATDQLIAANQTKSAAASARFQKTQEEGPALLAASYPLRQIQGILEKNGGQLPTGKEAQNVMGAASLGNMVATLLGHPLTDDDSRLTSMELLKKYGTQIAQTQAASLGVHSNLGLESSEKTSPSTELSGPANLHLVDNLIRLNALAQKKAQFEHDYYIKHGSSPDSYDNFTQDWMKEISGPKAVPLSKYGRSVKLKSGEPGMYVPSTDASGFSLFPANAAEFEPSVMTPK